MLQNTVGVKSGFTFQPMKVQARGAAAGELRVIIAPFCSTVSVCIPRIPATVVRLSCFIMETHAACEQHGCPWWSASVMLP